MSILNVENMSHGFGARTIFEDASFRLLKGEHIALVGANGEGKSTFLSIITGQMTPDQGKVEWSKRVTTGYLDQHAVLQPGMTIRDVLKTAFDEMYKLEAEMLACYDKMGEASPEEMDEVISQMNGAIEPEPQEVPGVESIDMVSQEGSYVSDLEGGSPELGGMTANSNSMV